MSQPAGFWHDARALNATANGLFALALAAVLAVGAYRVAQLPQFRLRAVTIDAVEGTELRYVSASLLRATALSRLDGTFFTVDLDAVRDSFAGVPWVRRAQVRRLWPDRLRVSIEEHRPFALWGEGQALNTFGELFAANLDEVEEQGPMPVFSGPPGSEKTVLERYREMGQWLSPIGLQPTEVRLSTRYAWSARLSDGSTLLLGREQGLPIEERVRRWVAVYPRVARRVDQRATVVDLRYPNGFAVRTVAAQVKARSDDGGRAKPAAAVTKRKAAGTPGVAPRRGPAKSASVEGLRDGRSGAVPALTVAMDSMDRGKRAEY